MNKRLQMLLETQSMSQSQLSALLGVAGSSISHIISGRNKPSLDFIISLMKAFPTLNIEWFISGDGPMFKGSPSVKSTVTTDTRRDGFLFPDSQIPVSEEALQRLSESQAAAKGQDSSKESGARNSSLSSLQANASNSHSGKLLKIIAFFEDGTFQELS